MLEMLIKQETPRVSQYKKRNANILLTIDENNAPLTHGQVAKAFHVRPLTITRLRQRFVEEGLGACRAIKFSVNYTTGCATEECSRYGRLMS